MLIVPCSLTNLQQIMFQRLRQMASHIFIVQEALEKELELPAVDYLWTCIITDNTEHSSNEMDMLVALRKMIAEKEEKPEEGQGTEISFTKPREKSDAPKPKKKKSDTLIVRFTKFLKELKKSSKTEELRGRTLCQRCLDSPEDPHVTSCLHLYCKECLNNMANDASDRDLDHTPCDKCGEVYTESVPCGGLKQLQIRDLSASVFQCDKDKASPKKPHKLTMKYVDLKPEPLLSTKTAAVKGQLEKWLKEDPQCKIIVFTEWQMMQVPLEYPGYFILTLYTACIFSDGSVRRRAGNAAM